MSLVIDLSVNGRSIDRIEIINRGPTSAAEGEDEGGERRYEWRVMSGTFRKYRGELTHHRRCGARALAEAVLMDLVALDAADRSARVAGGDATGSYLPRGGTS